MLELSMTIANTTVSLGKYVDWTSLSIQEQINMPTTMTFNLTNSSPAFPGLLPRAYVQLYSTLKKRSLFTGYISATPQMTALGTGAASSLPSKRLFQFAVNCQSDDYLLSIKSVQYIPAFINQTQGAILTSIAETLCPGIFDTHSVMSGDIVPYYAYDPTQTWSEIAKTFGDGIRYRYKVRDKKIWYVPYDDAPLGIEYDEEAGESTFDPYKMQTTVLQVPIVNDVTVVGAVEAGNNHEDYFIGDGLTGNFPLLHKVFEGSSTLLLNDDWTESAFDVQQWYLNDPAGQFNLGDGALNMVCSFSFPLGTSFLQLNNAIELAGGVDVEHGEFGFNDTCSGIVGGLYLDESMSLTGCLAGFYISSPNGVTLGASGAAGVQIQPMYNNVPVMSGNMVTTQQNHTYVLRTLVTAPSYSRYEQQYKSQAGPVFGGGGDWLPGSISFYIEDTDIALATGFYYQPVITKFTVNNVNLPPFVVYGLINNEQLNITLGYTTIAQMPLGTLQAWEGPLGLMFPSGTALPLLPVWQGGYVGPVVPWPAGGSGAIWPPPLTRSDLTTQERMGQEDFIFQAAQITQGNEADVLAFYAQTLPTAGTPFRFQSWEAQASMSRLQSTGSIATEAAIVGDDGLRAAIVTNISPLPQTSEECDAAAAAFLLDHVGTLYNGTYVCTSFNFSQTSSDQTFWPTCGRFLNLNAPDRGLPKQRMLVTGVTITVGDAVGSMKPTLTLVPNQVGEVLNFSLTFGADMHLEKVLPNFLQPPASVLTPQDTANPLNPRNLYEIDNSFLPDVQATMCYPILDTTVNVVVSDNLGLSIEVRKTDTNWGNGATPDLVGVYPTTIVTMASKKGLRIGGVLGGVLGGSGGSPGPVGPQVHSFTNPALYPGTFTLRRQQYDQTWYLRYVQGGIYSRRSKVIRVVYPLQPNPPTIDSADTNFVQFDYGGSDVRSVMGFELRSSDNKTVIVQKPVYANADLLIDLTQTRATNPFTPLGGLDNFANAFGTIQMTSYASGQAPQGGINYGNFVIGYASGLPADAVITSIYPVLDMDYTKDGASASVACAPGTATTPGAVNLGGNSFGVFTASFMRKLVTGASIGTSLPLVGGSSIGLQMKNGGTNASMADEINVYGAGFAIYYNSATPITDPQMDAPFPVGPGQGMLWALPTSFQTFTSFANLSVTGSRAVPGGNLPTRNYFGYFFNQQWSYSPPTPLVLAKPAPPQLEEGYRFGQSVNVLSSTLPRNDITAQRFQVAYDTTFDNPLVDVTNNFQAGSTTFNVPVSADIYVRSVFSDFISSGDWSSALHIPLGDLLASDYLAAQGSVPPVITQDDEGIVSYASSTNVILVNTAPFSLLFPNGGEYTVNPAVARVTETLDTMQLLQPGSGYLFYLSMTSPGLANPSVLIDGPYANPSASALTNQASDGRVPLENGALTFFTSITPTGAAGGGAGGSFGGGQYCGVKTSKIQLADGTWKRLGDLEVGDVVDDSYGGAARVLEVKVVENVDVRTVYLSSGKRTRCGLAHTFEVDYGWEPLCDLIADFKATGVYPMISTVNGLERILAVDEQGEEDVVTLKLEGPRHTYLLDNIRTHNTLYKN